MSTGAGKGSRYRPVDRRKWDEGWERVFGRKAEPTAEAVKVTMTTKVPARGNQPVVLKSGEEVVEAKPC